MNVPHDDAVDSLRLWHPTVSDQFIEFARAKAEVRGCFFPAQTAAGLAMRPQLTAQRSHVTSSPSCSAKHDVCLDRRPFPPTAKSGCVELTCRASRQLRHEKA